jgi:CRP/FNR family transcriptional regulator, cyclic AMP receptor protein
LLGQTPVLDGIDRHAALALSCEALSDPKVDALARVPLFARCTRKELEFLATRTDEVDVKAGRTLIQQGSPADTFYVLLDGEADVQVDGRPRPPLRAGSFFGEISMLDRGPATATVVTTTPARLMVMSHMQFRDAIKANDQLLGQVMGAMAERLRRDTLDRQPS